MRIYLIPLILLSCCNFPDKTVSYDNCEEAIVTKQFVGETSSNESTVGITLVNSGMLGIGTNGVGINIGGLTFADETVHHPNEYNVRFNSSKFDFRFDDQSLFNRYEQNQKITVCYRSFYDIYTDEGRSVLSRTRFLNVKE